MNADITAEANLDTATTYYLAPLAYTSAVNYNSGDQTGHILRAYDLKNLLYYRADPTNTDLVQFAYCNGVGTGDDATVPVYRERVRAAVDLLFNSDVSVVREQARGALTFSGKECRGFTINTNDSFYDNYNSVKTINLKSYNNFSIGTATDINADFNYDSTTITVTDDDTPSRFTEQYVRMLCGSLFRHPRTRAPVVSEGAITIGNKVLLPDSSFATLSFGEYFANCLTAGSNTASSSKVEITSEPGEGVIYNSFPIVRNLYEQMLAVYPERFSVDDTDWTPLPFKTSDKVNFNVIINGSVTNNSTGTSTTIRWNAIPEKIRDSPLFKVPSNTTGTAARLEFTTDAATTAGDSVTRTYPSRSWKVNMVLGSETDDEAS